MALKGLLDRSADGKGCVVGLVGPPGIGKSRMVREIVSLAADKGVDVFSAYCESHTTDVPFHAAAGLLRAVTGSVGLDGADARAHIRSRFPDADDEDLLLLNDLLGIGDPAAVLLQIDPDARRRRIAAMVKATALDRSTPTVYVIEDAHWIDAISESMLAEFFTVVAADTHTGSDHLSAGIRWGTCSCASVADDRARAAGRIADAGAGHRTARR